MIRGGVRAQSAQRPVMRKQIGADRLFQLVPRERHPTEGVVIALKPHFITVVQRRDAEHGVLQQRCQLEQMRGGAALSGDSRATDSATVGTVIVAGFTAQYSRMRSVSCVPIRFISESDTGRG